MLTKHIPLTALTTLTAVSCALGTAPSALAAAPETADELLVKQWYDDFLGRTANEGLEKSGREYWVDQLREGQPRREVLGRILDSQEHAEDLVDVYYTRHLGRDADTDPAASYWVSRVRGEMEPEWVEQSVLASDEYAERTGDDRVEAWYRGVLGRTGDDVVGDADRAYWQGRIDAVGPLHAVREMWYSPEAVEHRIRVTFEDLLDRTGDEVSAGDVAAWYEQAVDSRAAMEAEMALSPEYLERP